MRYQKHMSQNALYEAPGWLQMEAVVESRQNLAHRMEIMKAQEMQACLLFS